MCHHEENKCPRCCQPFECKVGNISNCQCNDIRLTDAERTFIESHYQDCLCFNCLKELKQGADFSEKSIFLMGINKDAG